MNSLRENQLLIVVGVLYLLFQNALIYFVQNSVFYSPDFHISDTTGFIKWALADHFFEWEVRDTKAPWLPLFPILIRLLHTLTLGLLNPHLVIALLNFAGWLGIIHFTFRTFGDFSLRYQKFATMVIAIWFMSGVSMMAGLSKEIVNYFFIVLAIYSVRRDKPLLLLLAVGCGLLTHKVLWVFYFAISIYALVRIRYRVWMLIVSGLPLVLYNFIMAYHHPEYGLFYVLDETSSITREDWRIAPVFDPLIGGFIVTDPIEIVKNLINWTFLILSTGFAALALKRRGDWFPLVLILHFYAALLVLPAIYSWGPVRYAVPLGFAVLLAVPLLPRLHERLKTSAAYWLLLVALLLSNVAWTWYGFIIFPD